MAMMKKSHPFFNKFPEKAFYCISMLELSISARWPHAHPVIPTGIMLLCKLNKTDRKDDGLLH